MTQSSNSANWIDAWLETQQGWLGRWQATAMEQRVDAMRMGMETLRQQCNPANPSPEMLNVAQGFQSLLQSCMASATQKTGATAQQSNPFLDIMQTLPLGYAREQQLAWQAYLKAQTEYQHSATQLLQQFVSVLSKSLELVPQAVTQRSHGEKPIQSMRELYEVWIECGEQCFAAIAQDEQFIAIQTNHSNALSRLRIAEHALLEDWLKQHDLPTRSELNSVHQKLRSMSSRIVELEQQLVAQQKSTNTTRSKKKS